MFTRKSGLVWWVFLLLLLRAWVGVPDLLPEDWVLGSQVVISGVVIEEPYPTEFGYVLRMGRYVIYSGEYMGVFAGDRVRVVGQAEPREVLGKQVSVFLRNPEIERVEGGRQIGWIDRVRIALVRVRVKMVGVMSENLPEPHASLAAGVLLGVRAKMPDEFYQALVETGTLHVIAASGYNVMIVLRVVMGVVLLFFSRKMGLVVGFLFVIFYVVIAGGSAAVVRAALMGILTYSAYFWGRVTDAKRLLWMAVGLMLVVQPLMLVDVGFQLSVAATVGILYLEPGIKGWFRRSFGGLKESMAGKFLGENLYPTLAAYVTTTPLIWWYFGRVSLLSPVVNVLVLGLVPLIMFLSFVVVMMGWIPLVGRVVSLALYVPLEFFVRVVEWFGKMG